MWDSGKHEGIHSRMRILVWQRLPHDLGPGHPTVSHRGLAVRAPVDIPTLDPKMTATFIALPN